MPPADSSLNLGNGSFELLHSLKAYNKIPVHEFRSTRTGLTVIVAEVEGPVVNGYFALATEAFDDDGLPHTLEHLIFLGSEQYPYKGVLDLLANRCLASGTNAWTDIDHTCYTMETAGSEGFLSLLPIFMDHILYPVLNDGGFITEVHHITGEGEDAGVVYCEMQGRENSGESRVHLTMARKIYPGYCGYSSETGGIMKNLRESTNNEKVRSYHKAFYRPENLRVIITGQIAPDEIFRALAPFEDKIIAKGERGPFTRPWQSPVPPLLDSEALVIRYPSDEENNGMVSVAWRGPSAVTDLYTTNACSILLKYLCDLSVSPLQKEFVEQEDPYASEVSYSITENAETCLYLMFQNVPNDKLPLIKPKLDTILKKIVDSDDIDMQRLKSIITRYKLESLSALENNPHCSIAYMLVGHMLYGNTKEDLEQRLNPLANLDAMGKELKSYWIALLQKYFVQNKVISIQAVPSIEEQQKMATEEKQRIEAQVCAFGPDGLKEKEKKLENAIAYNEREPPEKLLTCIPVPSIKSIKFHDVVRYNSTSKLNKHIDLFSTPVFTYFDHVNTSFVYIIALLDSNTLSPEQRLYLPLLLETLLESPIERDGKLIPYEEVVAKLQDDTIAVAQEIGLSGGGRFKCGMFSHTVSVVLQVEPSKYELGVNWLKELLYKTKFTVERLKIIATKMINDVAQAKRSGRGIVSYLMRALSYAPDSNHQANGVLKQHKFLTQLVEKLETSDGSSAILEMMESTRNIITDPSNLVLYLAANLDQLQPDPAKPLNEFLPVDLNVVAKQETLKITPDWKLLAQTCEGHLSRCIVGMGCLESSFFYQTAPSLTSYDDPDMPALSVYFQYLIQAEGPMWKQIRGKGYSYGFSICLRASEGLLYLIFSRATNVVGAYKETYNIVTKQLETEVWDSNLLESAKSSLIYERVQSEESIGDVVNHSMQTYFYGVEYEYNRQLLSLIEKVTTDDLNRVGKKYVAGLFNPDKVKTAIVCDPAKIEEIANGFKKFNIDLKVYPSLEESFLNQ